MGAFIFAMILFVIALVGLLVTLFAPEAETKLAGIAVLVIGAIVGGICIFASGYNTVPIRNVGIEQSYGKIVGQPLTPGFHWLAPWDSVINIPVTTTTDNYNQNTNTPHYTGTCITIRLGEGQEGCADVSVTYAINDAGAQKLLAKYGAGNIAEQVQNNLVYNNIRQALNNAMGDYDPITDALQTGTSGTSQFSQFVPAVTTAIQTALNGEVSVTGFDLQYVHYSTAVQDQLDGIQQKQGQLQQEIEQQQINTATAQANQDLVSKTGALTSQQLQQECLSIVQTAEKDNYSLPATWGNCITNTSGTAIVNTSK